MHRKHPALVAFVTLYMLVFAGVAFRAGNSEFVFYGVVMVLLIAGILWMHRRVRFSTPVLWGLAVWGLLHMAGGNVPIPESAADEGAAVLYSFRPRPYLPKYDQVVHAFGFFVATLASFEALRAGTGVARPTPGLAVASFLMGMGLGAANEIVEFVATLTIPETNVGGYVNTGWDLVSNGIGAALGAAVTMLRKPPETNEPRA